MAVDELDRDYLKLLHVCDGIENIIGGMKMDQETDSEKKKQVGNMVMHLEMEMLDSKYTDAKKDITRINSTITAGRAYWKS
tara:strand:+ start:844 stop:1086 length:243 start_codon:yes stop_codon:yes gene_type:complete